MVPKQYLRLMAFLAAASVLFLSSCGLARVPSGDAVRVRAPGSRDPRWAIPREGKGLRNFYQVSLELYRGAQPTAEGIQELRRIGVKTVVSLRAFHGEREMVLAGGLDYERISFKVWHPEDEDMLRFLRIVVDRERQPVFVHCYRGADRTGTAVAVYRICIQGWSKDEAIDEMVNGGYGFAKRFGHLAGYVRSLDVERLLAAMAMPPD